MLNYCPEMLRIVSWMLESRFYRRKLKYQQDKPRVPALHSGPMDLVKSIAQLRRSPLNYAEVTVHGAETEFEDGARFWSEGMCRRLPDTSGIVHDVQGAHNGEGGTKLS
jgi:hypothetical protein